MSISGVVKSIQEIMRQDAGVDGDAQRIGQLAWMFFLKIFDDKEHERQAILELEGRAYVSPVPDRFRWACWAADPEGMTGEELLNFVNNDLFPTLKGLDVSDGDRRRLVVREAFSDAHNYMKSGTLLRQVINKINQIDFNRREDQHLFGDIYEQILRDLQSAGNAGEFYTPRPVTQFMVEMVDPQLGEIVLDPACGTGGFLTNAIDHIAHYYVQSAEDRLLLQESIRGVEKKQLPHLLATTNLMLHGIDVPVRLLHDNSLARPYGSYGPSDQVDVILTNPPFGGTEEEGVETNFPGPYRTKETADLFVAVILRLLKPGGRAALVLPNNFLQNGGVTRRLKEDLLSRFSVHTIVRLPPGVFSPYTKIPTNLIFFENSGSDTDTIWYYQLPLPAGYNAYTKTKPIQYGEFKDVVEWWNNRTENEHAWQVDVTEIRNREYNLDIPNPRAVPSVYDTTPTEVLERLNVIRERIDRLQASSQQFVYRPPEGSAPMKLGSLLKTEERRVLVEDDKEYALLGVKWYGEGVWQKEKKLGREIKAKHLYEVKAGDLIYNRLFAWKGSFALVPPELDETFASNEFPTFRIREEKVLPEYLLMFLSQRSIWSYIEARSTGVTSVSRNRFKVPDFLDLEISLPDLAYQKGVVEEYWIRRRLREGYETASQLSELLLEITLPELVDQLPGES